MYTGSGVLNWTFGNTLKMFSVSIRLEQRSNDTVGSLARVNQHSPVQHEEWMVTTSYLCSNHLHTSTYLVATYYPSY
jgi:hypothetical protein